MNIYHIRELIFGQGVSMFALLELGVVVVDLFDVGLP